VLPRPSSPSHDHEGAVKPRVVATFLEMEVTADGEAPAVCSRILHRTARPVEPFPRCG
jgi:hypothetical protein